MNLLGDYKPDVVCESALSVKLSGGAFVKKAARLRDGGGGIELSEPTEPTELTGLTGLTGGVQVVHVGRETVVDVQKGGKSKDKTFGFKVRTGKQITYFKVDESPQNAPTNGDSWVAAIKEQIETQRRRGELQDKLVKLFSKEVRARAKQVKTIGLRTNDRLRALFASQLR